MEYKGIHAIPYTQTQTARLLADKYAHSLKFKMFIFLSCSFHFTSAHTAKKILLTMDECMHACKETTRKLKFSLICVDG